MELDLWIQQDLVARFEVPVGETELGPRRRKAVRDPGRRPLRPGGIRASGEQRQNRAGDRDIQGRRDSASGSGAGSMLRVRLYRAVLHLRPRAARPKLIAFSRCSRRKAGESDQAVPWQGDRLIRATKNTGRRAGVPTHARYVRRASGVGGRLVAIVFVGVMCAGLAGAARHDHDGVVTPNACAVCHARVEAHGPVPVGPAIIGSGRIIRESHDIPVSRPASRRRLPGIHGPRSPPA